MPQYLCEYRLNILNGIFDRNFGVRFFPLRSLSGIRNRISEDNVNSAVIQRGWYR